MFFALITAVMLLFSLFCAKFWQWFWQTDKGSLKHNAIYIGTFSVSLILPAAVRLGRVGFRINASWMVLMLFTLFSAIAVWLLWLLLRKSVSRPKLDIGLRAFSLLFLVGITGYAVYSAYIPTVRRISITIDKPMAKPVRIGMASDLHLGYLFRGKQLDDLAAIMKREKADIVLLPGDIMDDDTTAYDRYNMKQSLEKLRAPLGVYATMGNHDLFGHESEIRKALTEAGVRVLSDEVLKIDNNFWLIGRPDDNDRNRRPTAELLKKADTSQPVFLMDHRPTGILQHQNMPIDLQVSGHVHNGQVFPANFIVKAINRISYGHEKIGLGHYIVTSGYGFWGVPFRLGSQSEVWIIDVKSGRQR